MKSPQTLHRSWRAALPRDFAEGDMRGFVTYSALHNLDFKQTRESAPMLRILPLLLILTAAPALAEKPDPVQPTAPDGLEFFDASDMTMNAAIAEAQATLPLFFDQVMDGNGMSQAGAIKVSFQTFPENVGNEIIWVGQFRRLPDGTFEGVLNNQPYNLGTWQQGDLVSFPASAIQDWSLSTPQGSLGNYTTRVIAAQPGNEYILQSLAPNPVPEDWR
ncbi:DUF2314 domain-containing protein [Gymnodinialimonas sp. 2305UL16-5]|uniref:DUF2314 domain-containing protein n=1 Tax=Gymnodinialimonas mytili TaxID=3126503 RepID=UPI0030B2A400